MIDDGNGVSPGPRRPPQARPAPLLRLRVAVDHLKLDTQLAHGADPSTRPDLALRAAQLESRNQRRAIARMVREVIAQASGPPQPIAVAALILARPQIRTERQRLTALAARLDAPEPARVQGVAIALLLMTDAVLSPIYEPSEQGLIGGVAQDAIACMDASTPTSLLWPPAPRPRAKKRPRAISTVLVCGHPDDDNVIARRVRICDRLVAVVGADELDRRLAVGICPDSSPALSLRARRLIDIRTRRELARTIGTLIRAARVPNHPYSSRVPICRRKVTEADALLRELSGRLLAPGPINGRGVAETQCLLTDGSGPLYSHPGADDLVPALQAAVDALEVWE